MAMRRTGQGKAEPEQEAGPQVATVRKAGRTLVLTVPTLVRKALALAEGQQLTVWVEGDRLIYAPKGARRRRSKYTLDELLAQCDFSQPISDEVRAWLDAEPAGREVL